jgi:hypothetical protein
MRYWGLLPIGNFFAHFVKKTFFGPFSLRKPALVAYFAGVDLILETSAPYQWLRKTSREGDRFCEKALSIVTSYVCFGSSAVRSLRSAGLQLP